MHILEYSDMYVPWRMEETRMYILFKHIPMCLAYFPRDLLSRAVTGHHNTISESGKFDVRVRNSTAMELQSCDSNNYTIISLW